MVEIHFMPKEEYCVNPASIMPEAHKQFKFRGTCIQLPSECDSQWLKANHGLSSRHVKQITDTLKRHIEYVTGYLHNHSGNRFMIARVHGASDRLCASLSDLMKKKIVRSYNFDNPNAHFGEISSNEEKQMLTEATELKDILLFIELYEDDKGQNH
jgi:hypothetical protein